jgi:hypothetical protein
MRHNDRRPGPGFQAAAERSPGIRREEDLFTLLSELSDGFASLKLRIRAISRYIHSFHEITSCLQSTYNKEFDVSRTTSSTSIASLISRKFSSASSDLLSLRTLEAKLKLTIDDLTCKKTSFDARSANAQNLLSDPLDDLHWSEQQTSALESEVDSLFATASTTMESSLLDDDLDHPDPVLRRLELQRRIAEIRREKALIGHRTHRKPERSFASPRSTPEKVAIPIVDHNFEQLKLRQVALDNRTKQTEIFEAECNSKRAEIESSYSSKMHLISSLTEQIAESERLQIACHNLSVAVHSAKNKLLTLNDQKRALERSRALQQTKSQSVQISAARLEELRAQLAPKQEKIAKREQELVRRRALVAQERESLASLGVQFHQQEKAIVVSEKELAETERKCDQLNEVLSREEEEVDRALFAASSMRADSRVQRLQLLLDARTTSTFVDKTFGTTGESVVDLIGWRTTQ